MEAEACVRTGNNCDASTAGLAGVRVCGVGSDVADGGVDHGAGADTPTTALRGRRGHHLQLVARAQACTCRPYVQEAHSTAQRSNSNQASAAEWEGRAVRWLGGGEGDGGWL